jgi:hypothetical protein
MSGQGGAPFGGGGGGDYIRDRFPETYEEYLAGKQGGGAGAGTYVSFDNELGEVTLRLPPKYQKWSGELLEQLYDEFFGSPAGDPKVQENMNLYVAEWLKKRESEEGQLDRF